MAKTLEEMIEVMTAFKNGKKIEVAHIAVDDWEECREPMWSWGINDYRIKEEPKYRPYKDTTEMLEDFCIKYGVKRTGFGEPFVWVRHNKAYKMKYLITAYSDGTIRLGNYECNLQELFNNYSYLDGSPIGKIEE